MTPELAVLIGTGRLTNGRRRRSVLVAILLVLIAVATIVHPDWFLAQFRPTDRTVLSRMTADQTWSNVWVVLAGGGWYRTVHDQNAADAPAVSYDRWESGDNRLYVYYDANGRLTAAYFGNSHYEPTLWDWILRPTETRGNLAAR